MLPINQFGFSRLHLNRFSDLRLAYLYARARKLSHPFLRLLGVEGDEHLRVHLLYELQQLLTRRMSG